MIWDKEVVDLANEIKKNIQDGHAEKALARFSTLRKLTHIDPPPENSYLKLPVPTVPHFGIVSLPDEDW